MTFPTTHPALARTLAARGYDEATAVQTAVLQEHAAARDLLVSAQTGSGKTVAFGLAIAPTLLGGDDRFSQAGEPLALIVAPTRELALQVQRELDWLYAETGARVITCVGGMDVRAEARQLANGAHIVVGTPGRLRDHLERKRLDLTHLRSVVLDEADEMLDLGFREDLEFILEATPETRQTLLFSATMPRAIETLARSYQRDAVRIETARRNEQHADIDYQAIRVASHDVQNAVVNVLRLHEMRSALVFCATREAVKRMSDGLAQRGFSAVALSGELSQAERNQALQSLRDGRSRVLVATDVAARGLDLPDLTLVIHADLPNDGETLLHRSGRTGRAGKKGLCVLVVPFNKRRKAESLLMAARLKVTWAAPPTVAAIRARDQERFLADAIFTEPPADGDLELARILQSARTPDEIALALVRLHSARLPTPQELAADAGPPRREERGGYERPRARDGEVRRTTGYVASTPAPRERSEYGKSERSEPAKAERGEHSKSERRDYGTSERSAQVASESRERPRPERREAPAKQHSEPAAYERRERPDRGDRRESGADMVWFRLNIGRERNADPRWLVPLICKAGGVSKSEIGSIKIFDRDTRFQIRAEFADQFADSVRRNPDKEGHIARVGAAATEHEPTEAYEPLRATPKRERAGSGPADQRANEPASRPRYEAPRRDQAPRGKPAPRPHRKGTRPPTAGGEATTARPAGAPASAYKPKAPSKYANKKKGRAGQPGKA